MSRLVIVSNRLPLTLHLQNDQIQFRESNGGLATGLCGPHRAREGLWVGWPGPSFQLDKTQSKSLSRKLLEKRFVAVTLQKDEVEAYYEKFSNGLLWPLFHYFLNELPYDDAHYAQYVRANERFADAVIRHHRPDDFIWVHDYHLMLLPQMLRERLPHSRIGFFLHIPFPAPDVFRILPVGKALLEGLLGADVIGFHVADSVQHFQRAVSELTGLAYRSEGFSLGERTVRLGAFPMGVAARQWSDLASSPAVEACLQSFGKDVTEQWFLGVDRLDYTKGLPRRLLAFEQLLLAHPELHGRVRLVQVAVPSRTQVKAYQELQAQVEALVGRIQGRFATPRWAPIHYVFRALSQTEVGALYRAADVLLVTPVRDGMNLVAKEFVAARSDLKGALVLSEFAGAAQELREAILVNPFDEATMARTFHQALILPPKEKARRMRAMRRRVMAHDVHRWVASFLQAAQKPPALSSPPAAERFFEAPWEPDLR
jgi:trehalose 6-phosphate synthase/phosphatase